MDNEPLEKMIGRIDGIVERYDQVPSHGRYPYELDFSSNLDELVVDGVASVSKLFNDFNASIAEETIDELNDENTTVALVSLENQEIEELLTNLKKGLGFIE
jgi:hypothetical protein